MDQQEDKKESLIVLLDDVEIWLKTITLWLRHFGFNNIKAFSDVEKFMEFYAVNEKKIDACIFLSLFLRISPRG